MLPKQSNWDDNERITQSRTSFLPVVDTSIVVALLRSVAKCESKLIAGLILTPNKNAIDKGN